MGSPQNSCMEKNTPGRKNNVPGAFAFLRAQRTFMLTVIGKISDAVVCSPGVPTLFSWRPEFVFRFAIALVFLVIVLSKGLVKLAYNSLGLSRHELTGLGQVQFQEHFSLCSRNIKKMFQDHSFLCARNIKNMCQENYLIFQEHCLDLFQEHFCYAPGTFF